jgi:hypothetical protein
LRKLAGGPLQLGAADEGVGTPDPTVKVLTARDYTYDRTGLPRYATAVRGVVSELTTHSNSPEGYASGVAIVTDSAFTDVVEWYRQQIPAGWHNQTIGDFHELANALSPQAIAGALGFGSANPSQSASSPSPAPAAPAAARVQISMFMPPAATPDKPGIMIVQQEGKPVTVMMQSHHGS